MTNEQLTKEVLRLSEENAEAIAEHKNINTILENHQREINIMQEDIKTTKNLAEDVHIMAINMGNMQKTLDDTSKKVDALASQEFVTYKENKKLIKDKVIVFIIGIVLTFIAIKLGLGNFI